MKRSLTTLCLLPLACVSCWNTAKQNDIVKETYIHKYGVPVTKDDWERQGQDGQTVALRSDGVTITTTYYKGVAHGPTSYTFPNSSTIHRVETYDNGVIASKRENYFSGIPMIEEAYEDGNATVTHWYDDGTPQAHEIYLNSFLLTGEYRTPLNVIESRVDDGNGTRMWFSTDGMLLTKDTVNNGQLTESISFYANGDPSTVSPYENGQIHGTRLTFFPGGVPHTVQQWQHGIQEGMTILYQNGEKVAEIPYVNGQKNGIELRYRDGQLLVEEVSWRDDVQHGQRKFYVDGEVKSEWYHEGELVNRTLFERMNMPHLSAE